MSPALYGPSLEELVSGGARRLSGDRLRYWAHLVPILLVAGDVSIPRVLPMKDYTGEVYKADNLRVTEEIKGSPGAWRTLLVWALEEVYPEYHRRRGLPHKCEERIHWIGEYLSQQNKAVEMDADEYRAEYAAYCGECGGDIRDEELTGDGPETPEIECPHCGAELGPSDTVEAAARPCAVAWRTAEEAEVRLEEVRDLGAKILGLPSAVGFGGPRARLLVALEALEGSDLGEEHKDALRGLLRLAGISL